jgi:hypothetical protein
MMISMRRLLFAIMQIGFGMMVLLGSTFEALNLLVPSLLPEIQNNPLMALHHENRVVFWWTLLSNLATIPIAIALVVSGIGVARGRVASSRLALKTAALFALIVAGGAIVSGLYLVPPLLTKMSGSMRTIMLVSIGSALIGLTGALLVIAAGNRAILRRA